MTKRSYLKKLAKSLKNVSAREREDLVSYYDELIEDLYEQGKTPREVFDELEPPETVAENYLRDRTSAEGKKRKGRKRGGGLLRFVGGFFAVIMSIVCIVLIAAFAIVAVALAAGGVYVLAISFGLLVGKHAGLFFAQWGMAFSLFALAMLSEVLTVLLCKGFAGMWRGVTGSDKHGKPLGKGTRRTLIAGCAVLLFGGVMFTSAFGALGFRGENLAVTEGLAVHEEVLDVTDALSLQADNLAVTVKKSEDETCKLVYRDFSEDPRAFTFENGKAVLGYEDDATWMMGSSLKLQWRRGIFIAAVGDLKDEGELYLPASFSGDLRLEIANGRVSVADMVYAELNVTTKNGAVQLTNITADKVAATTINGAVKLSNITAETVTAETSNGAIKFQDIACAQAQSTTSNGAIVLEDVTAETVTVEVSNGAIKFQDVACTRVQSSSSNGAILLEDLRADDLALRTGNGAITGTVIGSAADYAIEAACGAGSCNLQNRTAGEKRLEAHTRNGAITIHFTAE